MVKIRHTLNFNITDLLLRNGGGGSQNALKLLGWITRRVVLSLPTRHPTPSLPVIPWDLVCRSFSGILPV